MKKFNFARRGCNDNKELKFWDVLKRCFLATLMFFSISLIVMIILSLVLFNTKDPNLYINYAGKGALFSSALLSSFVLSKINGQRYIPSGIILGLLIALIIFVLFLIFNDADQGIKIIWLALIPIATLLGSVLGIKREKKAKHKKHR